MDVLVIEKTASRSLQAKVPTTLYAKAKAPTTLYYRKYSTQNQHFVKCFLTQTILIIVWIPILLILIQLRYRVFLCRKSVMNISRACDHGAIFWQNIRICVMCSSCWKRWDFAGARNHCEGSALCFYQIEMVKGPCAHLVLQERPVELPRKRTTVPLVRGHMIRLQSCKISYIISANTETKHFIHHKTRLLQYLTLSPLSDFRNKALIW
jgi:hypothetical protein